MSIVNREVNLIGVLVKDKDLENVSDCWSRNFDYVNYVRICKLKHLTPMSVLKYNQLCQVLTTEYNEATGGYYEKRFKH